MPPDAAAAQRAHQRPRHRDDGVKAPKQRELEPFVQARDPTEATRSVDGGDGCEAERASNSGVDHVRPAAVRVDDVRPELDAQLSDQATLPNVGPRWNAQHMQLYCCG